MVQKYNLTLQKVHQLTPTVKGFDFTITPELNYKTGQWVGLEIPTPEGIIKRAMSIASPSYEKTNLHFCVKLVEGGKGSTALHQMEEGTKIEATGPFGIFTLKYPTNADIIMVATGSGIAPFRAMLYDLLEQKKATNQIYLLFGNRTEDEIIYRQLFEELEEDYPNFHFIPALSRPKQDWQGEVGWVQDLVRKYVNPADKNKDFYLCGLKDMVLTTVELIEKAGFPRERIHFERYT